MLRNKVGIKKMITVDGLVIYSMEYNVDDDDDVVFIQGIQ